MNNKAKILMIFLPLIFLIILSLIIFNQLKVKPKGLETVFIPTFSPTPIPVIQSKLSTDSGLLKIESDLSNFKKEIESLGFNDQLLIPPKLNFGLGL